MVNTGFATLDLKGIQIDAVKNTTYTVTGIYSKLEEFYNSYKFIALVNYTTKTGSSSAVPQQGRPVAVTVLRPTGATFYIITFGYPGIIVLQVSSSDVVKIMSITPYEVQPQTLSMARNENVSDTDTDTDTDILIKEVK